MDKGKQPGEWIVFSVFLNVSCCVGGLKAFLERSVIFKEMYFIDV